MEISKPITILLVEDDEIECKNMKDYIITRQDVKLIDVVNSKESAIKSIKFNLPDAIILDIELNNGEGSGLEVVNTLKTMHLNYKPIIVITTNISSQTVYTYAHENGVDMIFHKLKEDYSPELVVRNIVLLYQTMSSVKTVKIGKPKEESMSELREQFSQRINRELDLIGISSHLIGRKYIHDCIIYILEGNEDNENVFLHVAKKYKKGNSTIGRSIQTAIEHAWRKSSIEDLETYYTAAVNYNTGVPTPTELIYYYVDKIKKSM